MGAPNTKLVPRCRKSVILDDDVDRLRNISESCGINTDTKYDFKALLVLSLYQVSVTHALCT